MKVTDKKFLNVHQTISPLSVTSVSASKDAASEKSEKVLVRPRDQQQQQQQQFNSRVKPFWS